MNKFRWAKANYANNATWCLLGTSFEVCRGYDNMWDIIENDGYLASTKYVGTAKSLCERLAKSMDEPT